MRTFLRLVLMLLVIFISPLWILLFAFTRSGIDASWIKKELSTSNAYVLMVDGLHKAIETSLAQNDEGNDLAQLAPVVEKIITPQLIQTKVEKFVDDTQSWLTNKTPIPPAVSLLELKDLAIAQYPELAHEFSLSTSSDSQPKTIAIDPENDYGVPHLSRGSVFDQAINEKLTIQVGKKFAFVKVFYALVWKIFFVMTATILLSFLGMVFLSPEKRGGLRWIAITGIIVVFWNIVPFLLLASPAFLLTIILSQIGESYATLLPVLLKPVLAKLVTTEEILLGVLFIGSFILEIVSFLLPKPSVEVKK